MFVMWEVNDQLRHATDMQDGKVVDCWTSILVTQRSLNGELVNHDYLLIFNSISMW